MSSAPPISSYQVVSELGNDDVFFGPHTFKKLSVRDRRQIIKTIRERDRELLRRQLDEAKITGEAYLEKMQPYDNGPFDGNRFIDYLNDVDGKQDILTRSIVKAGKKAIPEELMTALEEEPLKFSQLVAAVSGLNLKLGNEADADADEGKKDEAGDENPTTNKQMEESVSR